RVNYTPKLKKRTALLRKLKDVFRRYQSQPVDRVVKLINPILRGWVNYFAVGHSSECFSFIQDWVEKKVRRHMGRAQNRKGFGWRRWSRRWLYETLRLACAVATVSRDELGARGSSAEHAAGRCDVPAACIMIWGDGIAEPAFDLHTQREGMDE